MDTLAPSLLVAMPQLQDPNFEHTVTLLIEANADGAFGLILNRISPIKVAEICAENELSCTRDLYVRVGGPCEQNRAWVLHGPERKAAETFVISPQIHLTPTWEMLGTLAQSGNEEDFLVFLGYAGWGPGQLEEELTQGSWLLTEVDPAIIFDREETDVWRAVLRKMGVEPGKLSIGGGGVN